MQCMLASEQLFVHLAMSVCALVSSILMQQMSQYDGSVSSRAITYALVEQVSLLGDFDSMLFVNRHLLRVQSSVSNYDEGR